MPRAVPDHTARREEDFEEDYDEESYELSEEEAPVPPRRTAKKPKKPAYLDEDSSSEVEEEPRPRRSKKKAKAGRESEDEESDDGRGKALVVHAKTSKAVAKRASSPKPKKKSRKVEESDDDDSEEETMKVERYGSLELHEIKPEFIHALTNVFERDTNKIVKWINKGFIRADLKKKEYDIGPVLDKECSKKDREKWDKFVKKTKKSKSKWIFQLLDKDDPYSADGILYVDKDSHNHRDFDPYSPRNHVEHVESPLHRSFNMYCPTCRILGFPCANTHSGYGYHDMGY
ncbi:MAG: hypothetical protein Q9167_002293 [Letrouitia subvulpina]